LELYSKGETIKTIASIMNVSHGCVRRKLVKKGRYIRPNRKYFFDEDIFEKIDCEWKAYYLGLFYADGFTGKLNIRLSLHEKDRELIDILNNIIMMENSISVTFLLKNL
jgi:hypothetical protein